MDRTGIYNALYKLVKAPLIDSARAIGYHFQAMHAKTASVTSRGRFGVETVKYLILTMRPKQWTKNAIVFAGLVFSMNLFDGRRVFLAGAAFVLFCLISSSVYIVNDLVDLENDQQHPKKRLRPLASGRLSPFFAKVGLVAILIVTLPTSFYLAPLFGAAVVAYLVTMLAYSFALKHMVIVDVFTLAGGFVLRAMAGALIIDVKISPWLYVVTVLGALFLGLSKRRHELLLLSDGAINHRKILDEYSSPLLEEMISVVTSSTVVAYSMYTFSAESLPRNHYMMLTIPFVIYAVFRYLYLVYRRNEGGSPEELLLKDTPLLLDICFWAVTSVIILYFFKS